MNYSRKEKNSGNTVFQNQVGKFSEIRIINKNLKLQIPPLCLLFSALHPCFCPAAWPVSETFLAPGNRLWLWGEGERFPLTLLSVCGWINNKVDTRQINRRKPNLVLWASVSSVTQWFLSLCDPMDCSTPGLPVHHQLPELVHPHVHGVSDAIQPSHPLSPLLLLPFPTSGSFLMSQFFASGGQSIGASASVLPMNIQDCSFRMDWFDLLAVQGSFKSLLQHHSSKESVLQHSAFFMVQLSHPYMTTGKNIALNIRTFVSKVMSLLFNGRS